LLDSSVVRERVFNSINSVLLLIIAALFLATVILSVVFFVSKNVREKKAFEQVQSATSSSDEQLKKLEEENVVMVFKDWGKIRTFTRDENPIPVIILPVIEYDRDNQPLHEEFCQKQPAIKKIITEYFTEKTENELKHSGETTVKREIIERINAVLSMGKISSLYFEEYLLLDYQLLNKFHRPQLLSRDVLFCRYLQDQILLSDKWED